MRPTFRLNYNLESATYLILGFRILGMPIAPRSEWIPLPQSEAYLSYIDPVNLRPHVYTNSQPNFHQRGIPTYQAAPAEQLKPSHVVFDHVSVRQISHFTPSLSGDEVTLRSTSEFTVRIAPPAIRTVVWRGVLSGLRLAACVGWACVTAPRVSWSEKRVSSRMID